ncbi:MAG: pentapeptide repeat-containing protein, partial [Chloroflexi bacterium]|nr:pentapeptide repeat-containing protein [Chloroflexota bacterium]
GEAHLEGADLSMAHLEGASFFEAHLEGAWLRQYLEGTDASGLTKEDIESADIDEHTWLPDYLSEDERQE